MLEDVTAVLSVVRAVTSADYSLGASEIALDDASLALYLRSLAVAAYIT